MTRWTLLLLLALGCVRPVALDLGGNTPDPAQCPTPRRTDVYDVAGGTKVDILVVLDTSPNMQVALVRAAGLLDPIFSNVFERAVLPDFHIAVAPTNLGGRFRPVAVPSQLPGEDCAGATFTRPPGACVSCARFLSASECLCAGTQRCAQVKALFNDLITVAPDDVTVPQQTYSVSMTLRAALGLSTSVGDSQPTVTPPPDNLGFYREDARLLVLLLAQGRDAALDGEGGKARHEEFVRELRTLKGPGRESDVTVVSIVPQMDGVLGTTNPTQICPQLHAQAKQSAVCASSVVSLTEFPTALGSCDICPQPSGSCGGTRVGEGSPGLAALACDLAGVVYNLCARDYSSVLGSQELQRALPGGKVLELPLGEPARFPPDACSATSGVCITVEAPSGQLIELDGSLDGAPYRLTDENTLTIDPEAGVAPGSRLLVRYDTKAANPKCCTTSADCDAAAGASCNAEGFCQGAACGPGESTACPAFISQCDAVTNTCVPINQCTRSEHCPAGYQCDCAARTCRVTRRP